MGLSRSPIVVLAGGVGAARFLRGLVHQVDPNEVIVIGNTGDDEIVHGLHISPDLDTVTYTLGNAVNPEAGWGLAGDTFHCMDALDRYGMPTWFRLGDNDLATHLYRSERLAAGSTLSEVTAEIATAWGIGVRLLPMSDDRVATRLEVADDGESRWLAMQEWFVRERTQPSVTKVEFVGSDAARPAPEVIAAIEEAAAIVICPSNPVLSIFPILSVPGIKEALVRRRVHVVAISPIIRGGTVKGPADRVMRSLGMEASCVGVARAYSDICSRLIIDTLDATHANAVSAVGLEPMVMETLMDDLSAATALAGAAIA